MLNKYFLLNQIVKTLISNNFSVLISKGCFDIAAKKDYKMLIKASFNLDALSESHALSLRSISYFVSAYPLIVSLKTNRGFLNDKIVYYRFKIPVVTPKLFELLVKSGEIPYIEAKKGKIVAKINCKLLKEKRKKMGLSLGKLARLVGISKKALYEIENEKVRPNLETIRRIEEILKVDLKEKFKLDFPEPSYLKPKNPFQEEVSKRLRKIGVENSCVYSAPFEIVGREEKALITRLILREEESLKYLNQIKSFSNFLSSRAIFIAKASKKENVNGIPIFSEEEIREIENLVEFEKILREKLNH